MTFSIEFYDTNKSAWDFFKNGVGERLLFYSEKEAEDYLNIKKLSAPFNLNYKIVKK